MTTCIGIPLLTRSEPGCAGKHCGQRRLHCVVLCLPTYANKGNSWCYL